MTSASDAATFIGEVTLGEALADTIMFTGTVDINAGAIDIKTIGATMASTGALTTLSASGAATFVGEVTLRPCR